MKNNKRRFNLLIIIVVILPFLYLYTTSKLDNDRNLLEVKGKFSMVLPKELTKQVSQDDNEGSYRSSTILLWYRYGEGQSCETLKWILEDEKPGIKETITKI